MNRLACTEFWKLLDGYEDHLAGDWRSAHAEPPEAGPAGELTASGACEAPDPVSGPGTAPKLEMEERRQALQALAERIRVCSLCGLHLGRTQAVPGVGPVDALVMVVGEGPGAEEDRSGLPFVGAAGQFLDKWLAAIELSRAVDVFIANTVKCRPPRNRDPQPEETRACLSYLEAQIGLVRPRFILVLGSVAARLLLSTTRGVSSLRGQWHELHGIPLICTFHPSAVLRDPSLKRAVWDDLKKLSERLRHA